MGTGRYELNGATFMVKIFNRTIDHARNTLNTTALDMTRNRGLSPIVPLNQQKTSGSGLAFQYLTLGSLIQNMSLQDLTP